jgi:chemotaxis signal transduction protein
VDCLLADAAYRPGRYLAFRIAGQEFAIDAGRVRGILPIHEMAAIEEASACSPACAEGVASLGGWDFQVIDLRSRLRLSRPARGRDRMIVVVEHAAPQGWQLVGFVADRVSGLIKARENDYRRGKLHTPGRPRRLLDPDAICGDAVCDEDVGRTPTSAPDPAGPLDPMRTRPASP